MAKVHGRQIKPPTLNNRNSGKAVSSEEAYFNVESDLLKEIGERLVSEPEVAITELVKNAYDADATTCTFRQTKEGIEISDDGHGMSENDFQSKWMTIATSNKEKQKKSKVFSRQLTGSKGIGRFAARFLGESLTLETVAHSNGKNWKLAATFDWQKIDKAKDLRKVPIHYTLVETDEDTGTTLKITKLRKRIDESVLHGVRSGILYLENPVFSFARKIARTNQKSHPTKDDPGFTFSYESASGNAENLSENVLSNYVFKVDLSLKGDQATILIESNDKGVVFNKTFKYPNQIDTDIVSQIRWFPKRAGVFWQKGIDGKEAWRWVRDNSGIAIVDNGFRVRPYGLEDDDWLYLDRDNSYRRRTWRTELAKKYFPIDEAIKGSPKLNPALVIPTNYQLVGVVAVSTAPDAPDDALIPSMDRQGFVENEAYKQLRNLIRFGLEGMAHFDKKLQLEEEKAEADRRKRQMRSSMKAIIQDIESRPTLSKDDKDRLTGHYQKALTEFKDLDEYHRKARASLTTMGLLGVVAGFMTHEYQAALMQLENASKIMKRFTKKVPELEEPYKKIQKTVDNFQGYISYTKLFISNVQNAEPSEFYVKPIIENVAEIFDTFRRERNINVDLDDIDENLIGPVIIPAVYQGVVHNLYTNALKALVASKIDSPTIRIVCWNTPDKHILQVIDNGIGIDEFARKRIWDPMYTTTSNENNPLGSGMGLGLPLVKQVLENSGGTINLVEPPANFTTCFKVEIGRQKN